MAIKDNQSDMADWLELTGWHDVPSRNKKLKQFRAYKALEKEEADIAAKKAALKQGWSDTPTPCTESSSDHLGQGSKNGINGYGSRSPALPKESKVATRSNQNGNSTDAASLSTAHYETPDIRESWAIYNAAYDDASVPGRADTPQYFEARDLDDQQSYSPVRWKEQVDMNTEQLSVAQTPVHNWEYSQNDSPTANQDSWGMDHNPRPAATKDNRSSTQNNFSASNKNASSDALAQVDKKSVRFMPTPSTEQVENTDRIRSYDRHTGQGNRRSRSRSRRSPRRSNRSPTPHNADKSRGDKFRQRSPMRERNSYRPSRDSNDLASRFSNPWAERREYPSNDDRLGGGSADRRGRDRDRDRDSQRPRPRGPPEVINEIDLGKDGDTRFFIMRSYTIKNIDESYIDGLWATTLDETGTLCEALRTCKNVILFFSVNQSKAFQGYARMTGFPDDSNHRPKWHKALNWAISAPFTIEWISKTEVDHRLFWGLNNAKNENMQVNRAKNGQEVDFECARSMIHIMNRYARHEL